MRHSPTPRRPDAWSSDHLLVRVGEHAAVGLLAVVSIGPLYVMIVASVQETDAARSSVAMVPRNPTLANYATAWQDLGFGAMFRNSVLLTLASSLLAVALATLAAYGLARHPFHGKRVALAVIIGAISVPPIVVVLPLFLQFSRWGWVNSPQSAILAEAGLLLPFATFVMYGFMRDLPNELFEAASIDGADSVRQFVSVALPLSRPGILTTLIVSAIFAWNDLLVPLVLWQSEQLQTLMVGLATLGPGRTGIRSVPLLMAGVAISVAPLILLFAVSRRLLVKGLTEGATK